MKERGFTIEPGRHNWKPQPIPSVYHRRCIRNGFEVEFVLHPNCWFDWRLEDGEVDRDVRDWNFKIAGLTEFFSANDVNAIIVVARPIPDVEGFFDVSIYSNYGPDDVLVGRYYELDPVMLRVRAGQRVRATIHPNGKEEWRATVGVVGKTEEEVFHPRKKSFAFYRSIDPWFGGKNNSKGKFGGVPSQFMSMRVAFKRIKR